tara:strand:+ start:189 stop:311 length:123 start_codon:yes stop_codon:yes gene_type:complete
MLVEANKMSEKEQNDRKFYITMLIIFLPLAAILKIVFLIT